MIRIFLPNNFEQDKDIFSIYTDIAEKIYQELDGLKVGYTKDDIEGELSTIDDIREFLLAKDFYKYIFDYRDGEKEGTFWGDFTNLPPMTRLKSFIEGVKPSKKVTEFLNRYKGDEYISEMETLEKNIRKNNAKTVSTYKKIYLDTKIIDAFNYDKIGTYRHIILTKMGVLICPYCNMNYTVEYGDKNNKKSTADIDHFYIKSEYPEYALCLYNFIPSCPVCNSKLKSTKSMNVEEYVYPHENSMEGKAKFQIDKIEKCFLDPNLKPKITLNNYSGDSKVDKSSKLFKTNEIYANFSDYAKDLLQKSICYSDKYRNELMKITHSQYELKEMIFGANKTEEEYSKESLGKLRMDLLKQLGVY